MEVQTVTQANQADWASVLERLGNAIVGIADKGVSLYDKYKTGQAERRALDAERQYLGWLQHQNPQTGQVQWDWGRVAILGGGLVLGAIAIVYVAKKL